MYHCEDEIIWKSVTFESIETTKVKVTLCFRQARRLMPVIYNVGDCVEPKDSQAYLSVARRENCSARSQSVTLLSVG